MLAQKLLAAGKHVHVHDPEAVKNFLAIVPGVKSGERDAIARVASVIVIMTEWDEYRTLTTEDLAALRGKTLVDCRNILARNVELEKLKAHGVCYVGLGIPAIK